MDLLNTEFKRKFSATFYKNLKLKLCEMTFYKDFVRDTRGDLYPVLEKSDECAELIDSNIYKVRGGSVKRLMGQFFPYATYEVSAEIICGSIGFSFILPEAEATLSLFADRLRFSCNGAWREIALSDRIEGEVTMIVSCRPRAFDVYFMRNGKAEFFCCFTEEAFSNSNLYPSFIEGAVALSVSGDVDVKSVVSYIDSGISIADMRTIRYENGDVMFEGGKIYFTASIRMQAEMFQGVFSWIPATEEFELTGALFYDSGDGKWCGDVAASVLYHRGEKKWYLWVCSFAHEHILGHSCFEGDPRFGVNVIDIELMEKASEGADISEFLGFEGDEDPDFFYDEKNDRWLMAICRVDPKIKRYRYMFFQSEKPFEGYRCIGRGMDGAETGGSFVRVDGELYFLCGNDFHTISDYRIYYSGGVERAKFNYPDGGFRGWGTLIPVKMGSRVRYFWLTFDRHNGSDYNWSYGNLYCFEAP